MIDASELRALAVDIGASQPRYVREVTRVVTKGALNVKNGWRANATASSGAHARHYPRTIDYDVRPLGLLVEAEIGPSGGGQADLAPVLEYGSPTSPPHRDGGRSADREEPRFFAALQAIPVLP